MSSNSDTNATAAAGPVVERGVRPHGSDFKDDGERHGAGSPGGDGARVHRAVWVYLGYRHWALKAEDGELLAEVRGTHPPGIYEYQGKRYHGEQEAKDAAMRALGAA